MSTTPRNEEYITIAEVKAAVAAMLPDLPEFPAPLDAATLQPTLRIRIEHSRTIKEGWSYSTTVEMDGIDATSWRAMNDARNVIEATLLEARKLGELERDTRNQRDHAAKEATAQIASNAS